MSPTGDFMRMMAGGGEWDFMSFLTPEAITSISHRFYDQGEKTNDKTTFSSTEGTATVILQTSRAGLPRHVPKASHEELKGHPRPLPLLPRNTTACLSSSMHLGRWGGGESLSLPTIYQKLADLPSRQILTLATAHPGLSPLPTLWVTPRAPHWTPSFQFCPNNPIRSPLKRSQSAFQYTKPGVTPPRSKPLPSGLGFQPGVQGRAVAGTQRSMNLDRKTTIASLSLISIPSCE